MAEKNINARVMQKHDIEANWNKATGFIPKQGEIIVYDKDSTHDYVRFKIGDGTTNVNNLPFAVKPFKTTTVSLLAANWIGTESPFSQTVSISGITSNSKIDLQPTPEQLASLQDDDISLMVLNNNGIATAYALNTKPAQDYNIQASIAEMETM